MIILQPNSFSTIEVFIPGACLKRGLHGLPSSFTLTRKLPYEFPQIYMLQRADGTSSNIRPAEFSCKVLHSMGFKSLNGLIVRLRSRRTLPFSKAKGLKESGYSAQDGLCLHQVSGFGVVIMK